MGVSITAKNSKYSFDGGYGQFCLLRENIALAFDKEFGEHYATLRKCFMNDDIKLFNEKANRILSNGRFKDEDVDIIDFLYASDCGGSISYKTCKKIYDLIKDIDYKGHHINYHAYASDNDYENFKEFLLDCYKHRRKMVWN